jgi:two-component system, OmpR family, alkaline phosphatase synthesis response regulator PhoP
MKNISILIVDDDDDILEFLQYNFKKNNFTVFTATNGKDGIDIAIKKKPDVIILDIMMDGMDGIQTCEKIRKIGKSNDSIIMFLSARGEDYTQIAGFDAGADDFVVKPINPRVLIKRVEALLKRKKDQTDFKAQTSSKITKIGTLIIDREKYEIVINDINIVLPRKEFNLLELLASKQDKVFTREEIFDTVWGDTFVGDRTIDVHIRKLREKLGEQSITTVKGIGYKINNKFF